MPTALVALVLIALSGSGYGQKEKPVLSEEIVEIIQHIHNECVQKTGVSEGDISNCENGVFKEDEKLKCYMFCLLEEGNLVDENDNVDYDMMISLIPEEYTERVTNMINSCKHHDVPGKSKCQRAFDVHKCSYEKDPKCTRAAKSTTTSVIARQPTSTTHLHASSRMG